MAKEGDLSKQLYKFQEAITAIALEIAGIASNKIHWPANGRPEGLTVNVDILIGKSPATASVNISVKHLTSGKESEKGGWRMMREILDSKANCSHKVKIFNVVFDDALKENWSVILTKFFDGFLSLPSESPFGPILVKKAYDYCKGALRKVEDSEARQLLRQAVTKGSADYDEELARATVAYGLRLKKLLKQDRPRIKSFWDRIATSCKRNLPAIEPRSTSFKRGLAKLLIFEPEDRQKIYNNFQNGSAIESLPKYALDLALAQEGAAGDWEITDEDIRSLFVILPRDSGGVCEFIFSKSPVSRMSEKYINPLREISNVMSFNEYIIDNLNSLVTADGMFAGLSECYADPMLILKGYKTVGTERSVWLFTALMALFKSTGGTRQSSGLTAIINETGIDPLQARFDIPAFVYREKPLKAAIMKEIAAYFARQLKQIGRDTLVTQLKETPDYFRQRLLEAQLIPYRQFDPIGVLLKDRLDRLGIAWTHHMNYSTCAKEFAGTESGGTTKAFEVLGKTPILVLWQSPNKNARDKAKEFAARVACLASRYDTATKSFVDRGVRIFMILDGIWDEDDIRSLLRFGCEKIFYPDEIQELVAEISKTPGLVKIEPILLATPADKALAEITKEESDSADD